MAIDWAKVRSAMTQTPDYNPGARGAGAGYRTTVGPETGTPYRGSGYGANQYNWGRNFGSRPKAGGGADYMSTIGTLNKVKTPPKADPNAWSQARYEMTRPDAYGMDEEELAKTGGVFDAARAAGSKFTTPFLEMGKQVLGGLGDMTEGMGRGVRLHKAFKDKYGGNSGEWKAAKAAGSKFTTPLLEMGRQVLGGVGDMAEGIGRGSRLHKAFKDKYGGSDEWKVAKASMMTPKDQAFYDKYMRLADMAQDNQKAQEYRDIAETAWRNQQTTDRLAQTMGFEGYDDPKYTDKRYTGGRREGQLVPGVERMANNPYIQALMAAGDDTGTGSLEGPVGSGMIPEEDILNIITGELDGPVGSGMDPDRIVPKMKPDPYNPYRDEDYGAPITYNPYRDEDYGAPIQPSWWDRFKKAPFENLPFYSGPFDWNFSPEYPSMDITEDLEDERGRLGLYD